MALNVNQRDVYLLPFPLNAKTPDHLFIVLSTAEANKVEGTFICVMITTSDQHYDDFSFDLANDMFEQPLNKPGSHLRMHLLTLYLENEIIGKRCNRMKEKYFRQLMASIGDLVFNYTFEPTDN